MLKKLAVALVVGAISVTGMTASAALALRITEPHDPTAKLYRSAPRTAGDEAKGHPWDEPCAIAETEATVLVDLGGLDSTATPYQRLRHGIGIEVRLLLSLRETKAPRTRAARGLLRELDRSIGADRRWLEAFVRTPTETQFNRWLVDASRRNARMAKLSKKIDARACADYFGN